MNQDFFSALALRLSALTSGLLFDHKPTGVKIAPQIINTMLPNRAGDYQENDEYPYVRFAVTKATFAARKVRPFTVHLVGAIYTGGTIDDGVRDISALGLALGEIVANRSFPPCRLDGDVECLFGDQEPGFEGTQPHPLYYLTMNMNFSQAG